MVSQSNYISAEPFTVEELRAAVFEGRGDLSPALALNLLALKDYPEKEVDMQRLLQAEETTPRLRVMAAHALGELASDTARSLLLGALETRDLLVLRGVVAALGQAGGREVVERVRQIDRNALDPATLMLMTRAAFTQDMDGFDLPESGELALLDAAQFEMQPITSKLASAKLRARVLADLQLNHLSIELEPQSALHIKCFGRDLLLVLNRALNNTALAVAARRRLVVGVIATFEGVEAESWSVDYYILTQPAANGAIDIRVVTDSGFIAYAGEGAVHDEQVEFSLGAVDHPGARAALIEGVYADGRVRLTHATTATEAQPRKTPQRLR